MRLSPEKGWPGPGEAAAPWGCRGWVRVASGVSPFPHGGSSPRRLRGWGGWGESPVTTKALPGRGWAPPDPLSAEGPCRPRGEGGRPRCPSALGRGHTAAGEGRGPGFLRGAVSVWPVPPHPSPILQASGAHRVHGARSSPLGGDRPHPLTPSSKGSFGDRLCDPAFPTGGTGGDMGYMTPSPPRGPSHSRGAGGG